jgi:hypothetical protein
MRRLSTVYARSPHHREDLIQNIFLATWEALPAFCGAAAIGPFSTPSLTTWHSPGRPEIGAQRSRLSLDEAPEAANPTPAPLDERRMLLYGPISRLPPVDRQLVSPWLDGFEYHRNGRYGQACGRAPLAVRLTNPAEPIGIVPDFEGPQWTNLQPPELLFEARVLSRRAVNGGSPYR